MLNFHLITYASRIWRGLRHPGRWTYGYALGLVARTCDALWYLILDGEASPAFLSLSMSAFFHVGGFFGLSICTISIGLQCLSTFHFHSLPFFFVEILLIHNCIDMSFIHYVTHVLHYLLCDPYLLALPKLCISLRDCGHSLLLCISTVHLGARIVRITFLYPGFSSMVTLSLFLDIVETEASFSVSVASWVPLHARHSFYRRCAMTDAYRSICNKISFNTISARRVIVLATGFVCGVPQQDGCNRCCNSYFCIYKYLRISPIIMISGSRRKINIRPTLNVSLPFRLSEPG